MRFIRNLVLSSAALMSTAAFAANQTRLTVPFNFQIKNHAYQAGSYRVEIDRSTSSVKLTSMENLTTPLMWIVEPAAADENRPTVSLSFDVIGQEHILRTVRYGSLITPNLDKQPKHRVDSVMTVGE